jgi:hypothetical protein
VHPAWRGVTTSHQLTRSLFESLTLICTITHLVNSHIYPLLGFYWLPGEGGQNPICWQHSSLRRTHIFPLLLTPDIPMTTLVTMRRVRELCIQRGEVWGCSLASSRCPFIHSLTIIVTLAGIAHSLITLKQLNPSLTDSFSCPPLASPLAALAQGA